MKTGESGVRRRRSVIALACLAGLWALWGLRPSSPPDADDVRFTLGIDVSHHQGSIDWRAVEQSGVRFAWIKATEGGTFVDPRFRENWAGAEASGLLRGAYHYFTFCRSGRVQADRFKATLGEADPDALPPAIDLEFAGNCSDFPSRSALSDELTVFIEAVADHFGKRPILYSTPRSYWAYVAGSGFELLSWRRDTVGAPRWPLRRPFDVWQYADDGVVPGIDGPVDLNLFAGSVEQLAKLGTAAR